MCRSRMELFIRSVKHWERCAALAEAERARGRGWGIMRSQSAVASPQDVSTCAFRYKCVFRGSLWAVADTHTHTQAAPPPHASAILRIYIKRGVRHTGSPLIKVSQC